MEGTISETPASSTPDRWIAQGQAVESEQFAELIKTDPEISEVSRIARDVAVLSMSADRAERLRHEFDGLVIERDREVNPPVVGRAPNG